MDKAGLGAFAQGLAGGIQQGTQNYANLTLKGMELEQERKKSALQQEHMNLVNDANKFEAALKVIEKSTDIAATQDYINKISLKNPFYKDTISAYAIADASTKKELKDFSEGISKMITTPSADAFSKAELKLAEAGVRFGADSNTYKSLKATMDIMKDAYGRDVTPKLVQQIDLGWQTMQKLGQELPAKGGLLQKQPGISDEELNAVNSFKTNLAELSRWSKPEYDRIVGQYGLGKTKDYAPQITPYKNTQTRKIDFLDANNPEDIKKIQSGIYEPYKAPLAISIDGLTKPTQTKLEEGIIEGEKRIMGLDETEKLFNSAFLEYKGKAISEVQKFADKLGLGTGTEFLQKRSAWMTQAKQEFLVYRKWVTGVAGGEKEFAEIAKAFPDPERNSPAEFKANLKQTKKWGAKLNNWLKYTRTVGLSITETPEEAAKAAKLMPKRLSPSGATTTEDLTGKSVEELLNMIQGTE